MSETKDIQENLNLYQEFNIRFKFKEEKTKESFESVLKEINNLKLLKFEPKLNLKSSVLENILPELKTNLTLNFEKYQIIIKKNNINIIFPKEESYPLRLPPIMSRAFTRSILREKEEEIKLTVREVKEIDDIFKFYLINKFFEIKEEIVPETIEINSIIKHPKEINFDFINDLLNKNIESNMKYEITTLDFDIKEDNNIYSLLFDLKTKEIFSLSLLKGKIKWSKSILDILNENIIKIKEIIREINL